MRGLLSTIRGVMGRTVGDQQVQLLPTDSNTPLRVELPYHDDPEQAPGERQQYIDPRNGRLRPLVVQSLQPCTELGQQAFGTWETVKAKTNASFALRAYPWVMAGVKRHNNAATTALTCFVAVLKAVILSPLFMLLNLARVEDPEPTKPGTHRSQGIKLDIPTQYPEFKGECHEYPKHACSTLDAVPAPTCQLDTRALNSNLNSTSSAEQKRLYRPRKLFLKVGKSWEIVDDDGVHADKPYLFISYAANQFEREADATGRVTLSAAASLSLQQRAEAIVEDQNLDAYWMDLLRSPHQPEATDDVHRFSDVVRGSAAVHVLLPEYKEVRNSLARFGKRLWCLPECLLAPGHAIHVHGGGGAETIPIMSLPARAWTAPYTDDSGVVVQGKGRKEEFRLLAEHFSGLLTLTRLELFSVALGAMRSLEFYPFQEGDMAYALMGLLTKRPSMDSSDSEQQALARLCLENDSDRIIERMVCMLPLRAVGERGWLGVEDGLGASLWNVEPMCQVAGICNDEAVIIDGCHAASIEWGKIPRMRFKSRKSTVQSQVLGALSLKLVLMFFFITLILTALIVETVTIVTGDRPRELRILLSYVWRWAYVMPSAFLAIGFITPFCMPFLFGGEVEEIQPWLVGFQGSMPIERLESLVFGDNTGRLSYTASSGLLCSRDALTRKGIAPTLDMDAIPTGHQIFTLLDTGSLTVTIFSAPRPPTVALICGSEGGMLRAVLCSYNPLTNALRKENVLRRERGTLRRSTLCAWIKVEL
ncbi:hypothetical protein V496_01118 [Pseudogymnoascus sp. VKM F-4515 (FW-2607)]|nr:hypothetical protein V496_01118 [Pseudogymnoascus sp. VKM F-4515 (FW-2607)]